jgi:branched-chain amino acid transport system substrate-binding protein
MPFLESLMRVRKWAHGSGKIAAAVAAGSLAVAALSACGTTDDATGAASPKDQPAPALTTEQVAWAADYIHGTAGKAADSSQSPIVIGFITQEGGTIAYPEVVPAGDATVKFINEKLGGVDGHPVELKKCLVATPEDVQKCGTEFANDSAIQAIAVPALFMNNGVFYSALAGKKVVFNNNLAFPEDFTSPNVFALAPTISSIASGSAYFANQLGLKKVAILRNDNPAGQATAAFYVDQLKQYGIKGTDVPVSEPGTAPEYAAAIKAAGVKDGEGLFPVLTSIGCSTVYDTLRTQNLKPVVLTNPGCITAPMPEHLAAAHEDSTEAPDGWYLVHWGFTPFQPEPNTNGMDAFVAALKNYAGTDAEIGGWAPSSFVNVLNAVRFTQEAGATTAKADAIAAKVKAFKGPAALVPGSISCGAISQAPNACSFTEGLSQMKAGKWESVYDGINGKFVDFLKLS